MTWDPAASPPLVTIPGPDSETPPPSPRELTQPVGGRRDDNQSGGHPQVCLGHSFRLTLAGTIRRSPAGFRLIAGQQVRLCQIAADSRSLLAGIQPKPAAEPTGQLRDPIGLGQGQGICVEELASMTPGLADDEVAASASSSAVADEFPTTGP